MKDSQHITVENDLLGTDRLQEIFDGMENKDRNVITMIAHKEKCSVLSALGGMIVKGQEASYASTPKFMLVH